MHQESTRPNPPPRKSREVTCSVCGRQFNTTVPHRETCSSACRKKLWSDTFHADTPLPQIGQQKRKRAAAVNAPKRHASRAVCIPAPEDEWTDEEAWLHRAQYWEAQQTPPPPVKDLQRSPRPERTPLVLNGHGARLRIHRGALVVRNGFTHYPQQNPELRYFPGDPDLPSRIIALDCDGALSLDVVQWLSQQDIPLILLSWQGEVVSVLGQQGPYDPILRQAQLNALNDGRGLELARRLIRDKIRGCQETLLTFRKTAERAAALHKLDVALMELDAMPSTVEDVRMIEARAALAYFTHWQELQLHWKGTGRKPIPPEWHRVGLRKGLFGTANRHATHPANAILNYAYAALESQVRIAAVSAGLDPTIGYLHVQHPGRLALVYDLMEPLRPKVDQMVLDLLREHVFAPSDFVMTQRGVCRLHPQLARIVARYGTPELTIEGVVSTVVSHLRGSSSLPHAVPTTAQAHTM